METTYAHLRTLSDVGIGLGLMVSVYRDIYRDARDLCCFLGGVKSILITVGFFFWQDTLGPATWGLLELMDWKCSI